MRVVYAATKEQEEYISSLAHYFYSHIFPRYFDDEQIEEFQHLQILSFQGGEFTYNGTMREAFHIISSLQSLITIIECIEENGGYDEYRNLFERNVTLLSQYGIVFPFTLEQFSKKRPFIFSKYAPRENDWFM
ncbi:DUF5365 family protein [Thermaerobacillus caldiproteolyticus]|uniref:DUF5365 family protein n=1 Tax=Thermaerobacillus caldiproteolyticus TaxID=247480 RepID=UPI00188D18B4|nr:DUF5365 family protein [Anoxybacillus caldiproteolyticus]QPA31486.1 YhcU family protein [Anoxybacillus caldiproteolyticus]